MCAPSNLPPACRSCFEDPEALKNPKPLSFDLDSLTDPTASEELTGLFCSRKRRGGERSAARPRRLCPRFCPLSALSSESPRLSFDLGCVFR